MKDKERTGQLTWELVWQKKEVATGVAKGAEHHDAILTRGMVWHRK